MGKYKDKEYKKKWYQKNKERIYQNSQTPEFKKRKSINDKKYSTIHREKVLLNKREYTKNHKQEKIAYDKQRRKEHPEIKKEYYNKYKERVLAGCKAREHINIPLGLFCQICNNELATQRHHEDYSKPLEVIFCCRLCHENLDRNRREREKASPEEMKKAYAEAWGI
jgi:hypothetical protein